MIVWWPLVAGAMLGGTVRAETSLEPIQYARVEITELNRQTITDRNGVFRFSDVPPGRWRLRVSALGYAPGSVVVEADDGTSTYDVILSPSPISLPALITEARTRAKDHFQILGEEIRLAPRIAEADVLRGLSSIPAVQFASDYSAGLYIRGGTPDQTVILLDGMPLLSPYHLGGALTAVDPDAVGTVDVHPGGLPASMGDRLAGYVNIFTREGARDRVHTAGGLGLASARFSVEGPLAKEGSFLVAGRRTYFDLLTATAQSAGLIESAVPYAFSDGHAKATYRFGPLNKLVLAGYINREKYHDKGDGSSTDLNARWGADALSFSYTRILADGWNAAALVSTSDFSAKARYVDPQAGARDSLDGMVGMSMQRFDASLSRDSEWALGLQVERTSSNAQIVSAGEDMARLFPRLNLDRSITTLAGYAEHEFRPSAHSSVRLGLRGFHAAGHGWRVLPRFKAQYDLSTRSTVTLSTGRYVQPFTSLRNEESSLARVFAYDISLPSAADEPLGSSTDVVLGFRTGSAAASLTADFYTKWLTDLWLSELPFDPEEAPVLTTERTRGSARVRGVEITATKPLGNWHLIGAYAGTLQDITIGHAKYTPSFNRAHNMSVSGTYSTRSSSIVLRAVVQSGLPFTPASDMVAKYRHQTEGSLPFAPAGEILLLDQHNSARLPTYYRVDFAVRKTFSTTLFGTSGRLTPYLDIFNLLNNRNALWGIPRSIDSAPRLEYGPQLPFLPTIGLEWKF